ncbi:MAG: hypothetical protein M3Y50_00830 [Acidobacteriota bacterium]|nr:hypothetical protein [Acidobacteriota bacterium]
MSIDRETAHQTTNHTGPHTNGAEPHKKSTDETPIFDSILSDLSAAQGVDFREYKPNTIRRRTQQRIAALGIADMEAYRIYLGNHPEEITRLSEHILVPVTEFFRNPEVFEDLASVVFRPSRGTRKRGPFGCG